VTSGNNEIDLKWAINFLRITWPLGCICVTWNTDIYNTYSTTPIVYSYQIVCNTPSHDWRFWISSQKRLDGTLFRSNRENGLPWLVFRHAWKCKAFGLRASRIAGTKCCQSSNTDCLCLVRGQLSALQQKLLYERTCSIRKTQKWLAVWYQKEWTMTWWKIRESTSWENTVYMQATLIVLLPGSAQFLHDASRKGHKKNKVWKRTLRFL